MGRNCNDNSRIPYCFALINMNEENKIPKKAEKAYLLPASIAMTMIILAGALVYAAGRASSEDKTPESHAVTAAVIVGTGSTVLPVR